MQSFKGLEVSVELEGVTYEASLEDEIEIDGQNLEGEFLNQAKKFAWWSMVSELAKDLMVGQKFQLDLLYARIDEEKRTNAQANKMKTTEKMIENMVITDQRYQEAMQEYHKAKKWYGLLASGREAFSQRKEMLISLGANYRMEATADPVLKQEKAKQKAVDVARKRKPVRTRTPVSRA